MEGIITDGVVVGAIRSPNSCPSVSRCGVTTAAQSLISRSTWPIFMGWMMDSEWREKRRQLFKAIYEAMVEDYGDYNIYQLKCKLRNMSILSSYETIRTVVLCLHSAKVITSNDTQKRITYSWGVVPYKLLTIAKEEQKALVTALNIIKREKIKQGEEADDGQ